MTTKKIPMSSIDFFWRAAGLVLFVTLMQFQLNRILFNSPHYDDVYNATVSKNLAIGYGYATSYDEKQPFNPEISTGFPLIGFTAVWIKIFGNKYWVPTFSSSVAILGLLCSVFLLLRVRVPRYVWAATVYFLISSFLFSNETTGTAEFGYLRWWYQLIGEVHCALLIGIACCILFSRVQSRRALPLGYFLFGIAFLTKAIALFSITILPLSLLFRKFVYKERLRAGVVILSVGLFVAPTVLWNVGQLASLGSHAEWKTLKAKEKFFRQYAGSGLTEFKRDGMRQIEKVVPRNLKLLVGQLGGTLSTVFFLLFVSVLMVFSLRRCRNSAVHQLVIGMLAASIGHFCWWILLSPEGWIRHLVVGIVLLLLGVSLAAAALENRQRYLLLLMLLPVATQFWVLKGLFPGFHPEPRLTALLNTVQYIEKSQLNDLYGCGWWANREIEYLLPSIGNFKDCMKRSKDLPFTLVRSEYWNWEKSAALARLQQNCELQKVFVDEPFEILKCTENYKGDL